MVVFLETGIICATVVASVMTKLLPIWAWATVAAICFFVIPPALYYREVKAKLRRHNAPLTQHIDPCSTVAQGTAGSFQYEVDALKGLVPVIERQIAARRPDSLSKTLMGHMVWSLPGDTRADYLELTATLNVIGVPSPANNARDEEWFSFLVELELLAKTGNLNKARVLYNEADFPGQPTALE